MHDGKKTLNLNKENIIFNTYISKKKKIADLEKKLFTILNTYLVHIDPDSVVEKSQRRVWKLFESENHQLIYEKSLSNSPVKVNAIYLDPNMTIEVCLYMQKSLLTFPRMSISQTRKLLFWSSANLTNGSLSKQKKLKT